MNYITRRNEARIAITLYEAEFELLGLQIEKSPTEENHWFIYAIGDTSKKALEGNGFWTRTHINQTEYLERQARTYKALLEAYKKNKAEAEIDALEVEQIQGKESLLRKDIDTLKSLIELDQAIIDEQETKLEAHQTRLSEFKAQLYQLIVPFEIRKYLAAGYKAPTNLVVEYLTKDLQAFISDTNSTLGLHKLSYYPVEWAEQKYNEVFKSYYAHKDEVIEQATDILYEAIVSNICDPCCQDIFQDYELSKKLYKSVKLQDGSFYHLSSKNMKLVTKLNKFLEDVETAGLAFEEKQNLNIALTTTTTRKVML